MASTIIRNWAARVRYAFMDAAAWCRWAGPLLIRSPIFWSLAAIVAGYWLLTVFVDRFTMLTCANAIRFVLSIGAAAAYFPGAVHNIIIGRPTRGGYLTVAICGSWAFETYIGGRALAYRLLDRPEQWLDGYDLSLFVLLSAAMAAMHSTAKSIPEGERVVPSEEWRKLGLWVAVAAGFGVLLLFLFTRENLIP